jgi:hypothetical protein
MLHGRTLGLAIFFPLPLVLSVAACGGNAGSQPAPSGDDGGVLLFPLPEGGPATKHPQGSGSGSGAPDASTPKPDAGTMISPPVGLTAVPLNVCVPSEYTVSVTLGGSQTFEMALDTGSTTLGVAASTCTNCGVSPEYTPGASAADQHQQGMSQYGTGSWSGEIYQDTVSVASGATAPVDFVAIDTQSSFFEPAMCNSKEAGLQGIIGFGPTDAALTGTNAFFDQLVSTAKVPNIFATELCDSGGTLWLGGYDPTHTTAAPKYTPLAGGLLADYYYAVNLVSVSVGSTTAPIATGNYQDSVVDTGTSVFILPSAAFTTLTTAIASTPAYAQIFGVSSGDTSFFANAQSCRPLTGQTKATLDAMLPPLTLTFGSNPSIEIQALPTESYLIAADGDWCPTFYSMDPGPDDPLAAILGSPVLRSNVVIFDRENQQIGFAPHTTCN